MAGLRIPFEEAVNEPKLLKPRFDSLSFPQQTVLKIANGLPLTGQVGPNGFSELDIWAATQGFGEFDDTGHLLRAFPEHCPYEPLDFREIWAIIGRRGSKSDSFGATQVVYEATLGGHEEFIRRGQQGICFMIAQDLRMARYSLHFLTACLDTSPILRKMVRNVTADRVELSNSMTIVCVPPTLKSTRGYASPISVMDEVGVWYQESDSANPDYEIYRALSPGQIQFPHRRLIGISTPWNKAGLLYKNFEAGTRGCKLRTDALRNEFQDVLVMHGPTALMGNPVVSRDYLIRERERDPKAFERECLAVFQDSISGFLPSELVNAAVIPGILDRPPLPLPTYVAALDPAFRRDAFALTIVHRDFEGKILIDATRRWLGSSAAPLNPRTVLAEASTLLKSYGISFVYSDQYQQESLDQLARDYGLEIIRTEFTAKFKANIYGNLQQLFYQRRIVLNDDPELRKELRQLERTISEGGQIQIAAPKGLHDDLASTLAIAAFKAMNMMEAVEKVEKEPTHYERHIAQLEQRQRDNQLTPWD